MNIYVVGVIVSIILYIVVGNYAGKKVKNIDDYYVSGRNATTILISGTLFASMLSTNGFMGDTAWVYDGNLTKLVLLNVLCGSGYIIGPMFFGRYLRRTEVVTMPEFYGKRFNSRRIQSFAGICTVISLTAYLLAVTQGTAILMEQLTGFSYGVCLIISFICFTSFTMYSGSSGVILTDTLMFMIFISATLVAGPFIFGEAGGASDLISNIIANPQIPSDMLSYHGILGEGETIFDALMYSLTMGIVWLITVSVSPWQASRNMMAKNEHVTFRAGVVACVCTTLFLAFLYSIAVAMKQINPNIVPSEQVIIWGAMNVMPKAVGVLILTGIMAAGLSSASTFLSVVGFSLTNDIVIREFKSEKEKLNASRITMLVAGIVTLIIAYFLPPSIRIISWLASTIIAASWGLVAFMSVWDKKITERGAFFGMVTGFVVFLIGKVLQSMGLPLNNFLDPFFLALIIGYISIKIGNKGQSITKEEKSFRDGMHEVPEEEKKPEHFKRDRAYAYLLIGAGVVATSVALVYWAIPFNQLISKL